MKKNENVKRPDNIFKYIYALDRDFSEFNYLNLSRKLKDLNSNKPIKDLNINK